MIRSMTGFGLGSFSEGDLCLQSEIRCVNHRQLSLDISLPAVLQALEPKAFRKLEDSFSRGRVRLTVRIMPGSASLESFVLNEGLARDAIAAWQSLARAEQLSQTINPGDILKIPGVLERAQVTLDTDKTWDILAHSLDLAIAAAYEMKSLEGHRLFKELLEKTDEIDELVEEIDLSRRSHEAAARDAIETRLKRVISEIELNPTMVMNEVAILAMKADISEELDRIKSHLVALRHTENQKDISAGKQLDFIAQEIQREAATMAAKAGIWGVGNEIVRLRTVADAIRQQAANLE